MSTFFSVPDTPAPGAPTPGAPTPGAPSPGQSLPGWPHVSSPFHEGEQALQARVGMRDKMEAVGRRVIRDFMPDQHRLFYEQLPFALLGALDGQGRPWAGLVAGAPGFIRSPDARRLRVDARPLPGDPLAECLHPGAPVGLLGIELPTRRRNRANGRLARVDAQGFEIEVGQSFGNCPKYIQARSIEYVEAGSAVAPMRRLERLDGDARRLVEEADTCFIASARPPRPAAGEYDPAAGDPAAGDPAAGDPAAGVDVSHRGGRPGFVRVDGNRLLMPDFAGNFHFNTLGNLLDHPRAGLLFVDFDGGARLYLAVDAAIRWDGPELEAFAGAERMLELTVREIRWAPAGLPLRAGAAELSPHLSRTGSHPV